MAHLKLQNRFRRHFGSCALAALLAFGLVFSAHADSLDDDPAPSANFDLLSLSDSFDETAANNSTTHFDAGSAGEWNVDLSTGNLAISFAPEPSRALLQLFGLSWIFLRRRRNFFSVS